MNCLRSMQFIKKISGYYAKFGLKTIVVHPPEWRFEKHKQNILKALKVNRIFLPLVIDKDKKIIKKFGINFWPAQLLIKDAKIMYKNVGEGNYKKLEVNIRNLLKVDGKIIFKKEPSYSEYPTVYTGRRKNGVIKRLENKLKFGKIYIKGLWAQKEEYIEGRSRNCEISIVTKGKIVNFVAKSLSKKQVKLKVKLNNKDIKNIKINKPGMYRIFQIKNDTQNILSLATGKNIAIYSFSFQ